MIRDNNIENFFSRTKELQDWIAACGSKEVIKERLRELPSKLREELVREALGDDRIAEKFERRIASCPKELQEILILEEYCKYEDILGWVAILQKRWDEGDLLNSNIGHSSSLVHVQPKLLPRRYCDNAVLASRASTFIEYTGEELYQEDLDVLLCLVKLSEKNYGVWQTVFPATILKMLGKPDSGQAYENLEAILRRLRQGLIFVNFELQDTESKNNTHAGVSKAGKKGKRKKKSGFISLNILRELSYARDSSIRYVLDPRLVRVFCNHECGLVDFYG